MHLYNLINVRIVNRYDVAGLTEDEFEYSIKTIFSEETVDNIYRDNISLKSNEVAFAMEFLPGQYDQRADLQWNVYNLSIKEGNSKKF